MFYEVLCVFTYYKAVREGGDCVSINVHVRFIDYVVKQFLVP